MRSDVHSKALRAAAKVAFSVVFLTGCSSAATEDANEPSDTEGTSEADLKSGCHGGATKDAAPPKDAAPKLSCEQVVASAFPTEGNYPGKKQSISAEVQTCCVELLEKSQGALEAHRWDCCANLPANPGQQINMACTPWGPPVPPRMQRRSLALAMQVLA